MKIIIASGFYNPIHFSHINYLNCARELGDYLYVIVNTDKQVKIKGSCPFQSELERLMIVKNLKCVNEVLLSIDKDGGVSDTIEQIYLSTIQENLRNYDLGFSNQTEYVFAKGGTRNPDNDAIPSKEVEICNKYGIHIEYGIGGFDKPTSSSSILRNVAEWYVKNDF